MSNELWVVGAGGWIIEDGSYGDFELGQEAVFGIEPTSAAISIKEAATSPSSMPVGEANRDFVGKLEFVGADAWLLNVGLVTYGVANYLPAGAQVGDTLIGNGYVGIECPGIHDVEAFRAGAPPYRYSWRIDRIEKETTPG